MVGIFQILLIAQKGRRELKGFTERSRSANHVIHYPQRGHVFQYLKSAVQNPELPEYPHFTIIICGCISFCERSDIRLQKSIRTQVEPVH